MIYIKKIKLTFATSDFWQGYKIQVPNVTLCEWAYNEYWVIFLALALIFNLQSMALVLGRTYELPLPFCGSVQCASFSQHTKINIRYSKSRKSRHRHFNSRKISAPSRFPCQNEFALCKKVETPKFQGVVDVFSSVNNWWDGWLIAFFAQLLWLIF